ncbi:aminotransferase class III-fold pyridoxal phosphate-dependent enzyme [Aurantivibrio plasticivorans]
MYTVNSDRKQFLKIIGFDHSITQAKGCELTCDNGDVLTDFSSQFGVMILGHNYPPIQEKIKSFIDSDQAIMIQPFATNYVEELAEKLKALMPSDEYGHVQFTNSGAETVEAALKLAKSATGREKILSTVQSFHGKTQGAAKATGNDVYREPFLISCNDTEHVCYGDLNELERALKTQQYAAFIVEPIQGEGGVNVPPEGYLREAQALCQQYKTLLIVDEIQTGLGRTGTLFAIEHEGIEPDMLLLAKGLSGGFLPIGALIIKKTAWTKNFGMYHSSTFANNNLAACVGGEVLKTLTQNNSEIIQQTALRGQYLKEKLKGLVERYPDVYQQVSGRGLMLGLKLTPWSGEKLYLMSFMSSVGFAVPMVSGYLLNKHKIVCLPTLNGNDTLRIQPSLLVTDQQIEKLLNALDDVALLLRNNQPERLVEYLRLIDPASDEASSASVASAKRETPNKPPKEKALNQGKCLGRFAFLLHPVDDDSMWGDSAFNGTDIDGEFRNELAAWLKKTRNWAKDQLDAGLAYQTERIYNKQGDYVLGYIITSILKPKELLALNTSQRRDILDNYFSVIEGLPIDYVGLGAYTSIISNAGIDVLDRGYHITTGNSLTALSCVEAIEKLSQQTAKPLNERTVAIAGAYGSVGRIASIALSEKAGNIILVGNPLSTDSIEKLRDLAGEIITHLITSSLVTASPIMQKIRQHSHHLVERVKNTSLSFSEVYELFLAEYTVSDSEFPITLSNKLRESLPGCDALMTATSMGKRFLDLSNCRSGTIICDASQPPDIRNHQQRDDVYIFSGGEIALPDSQLRFGTQNIAGQKTGEALACLSETIVLTMSGTREHQSTGKRPCFNRAKAILEQAKAFGFAIPCPVVSRLGPERRAG